MSLQTDIQEYKSACQEAATMYAAIGDDRATAVAMRTARWAVNKRKREAAENVIMSMLGEHGPAIHRAGLTKLYEAMAAGKHESDVAMFQIVEATCLHYDGK